MSKSSPTDQDRQQPPAAYSDPDWKNKVETGEPYEYHRFQRTAKARKRHERDKRMLMEYLAALPGNQLVLDAPSGQGRFSEIIRQAGHRALAMELNFGRVLDSIRRQLRPTLGIQGDVLHAPFADNSMDVVVCFRLLHHLSPEAAQQVLSELRRISRRALVTFYNKNTWNYYRQRIEGKTPHRNYYTKSTMRQWCRQAGWEIERISSSAGFFNNLYALWLR